MPLPRRAREERGRTSGGRGGSGSGGEAPPLWLRTVPDMEHVPEDYGDVLDEHGVAPATYQALERYLPSTIRAAPREQKLAVMLHVLVGEDPAVLRARQRQRDYMEAIQSAYQPLHLELFTLDPSAFFVPSFLQAVYSNTEDGFRSIMTELAPGVYIFAMLQPVFCQMLMAEVDHFQHWAYIMNRCIVRGNHMDKRSVNLSDFGLETMLDDLVKDFISPIIKGRYPELGALSLDSHHTFVTSYIQGEREGGEFTGGDMYFHGIRCGDHVNCEIQNEAWIREQDRHGEPGWPGVE
ncbi:hypothetical protein QOZ80_1BG0060900 [Eleusine coracana subsp. coracana]|nr:hypothetical protein QOZ80_1BG0060900 [Eleusine coracana subsp. coracana]